MYQNYAGYGYQQYPQYPQYQPQQTFQQQYQAPQPQTLKGQMVDGIDAVKAKDVDLSGTPVFYPNVNGTEIYKKQLYVDGTTRTFTYKLSDESQRQEPDHFTAALDSMKKELLEEIKTLIGG